MARCLVYVQCPHCASEYSSAEDESHAAGCPRPLERQLETLRRQQVINTCPWCKGETHVNSEDTNECTSCHAHWIPSWTQGTEAILASKVSFRMQGEPMPMTQLPGKGSGVFTRRDQVARLEAEVERLRAAFPKK